MLSGTSPFYSPNSVMSNHLIFIESNNVFVCGDNTYGALGQDNKSTTSTPLQLDFGSEKVSMISASSYSSFALVGVYMDVTLK